MWICHLYHSDLSLYIYVDLLSSSCLFVTSVIQSCHDIPMNLLCYVFVTSFIHICPHVHLDMSRDANVYKTDMS